MLSAALLVQHGLLNLLLYSPRLKKNIALAMIDVTANKLGQSVNVVIDENIRNGFIVEKPFYDPKKTLASS